MSLHEAFNRSSFARFVNSPSGRVLRVAVGASLLGAGFVYRDRTLGRAAMAWSVLPLTAGGFDLCFVSAALGGPLSGARIRASLPAAAAAPATAA